MIEAKAPRSNPAFTQPHPVWISQSVPPKASPSPGDGISTSQPWPSLRAGGIQSRELPTPITNPFRWLSVPGSVPPSLPTPPLVTAACRWTRGGVQPQILKGPWSILKHASENSPELDRPGSALFGPSPSLGACAVWTRGCSWQKTPLRQAGSGWVAARSLSSPSTRDPCDRQRSPRSLPHRAQAVSSCPG